MLFGKKREKQPPPPWLKWVLLAFLAVGVFGGMHRGPQSTNRIQESIDRAKENFSQQKFGLSDYRKRVFPGSNSTLRIRDIEAGSGTPAICGQKVSIAYTSWRPNDTQLEEKATRENPLSFALGSGEVADVFDQGVLGMSKGGKRSIVAPPVMSRKKEGDAPDIQMGENVRFEVELLDITPSLPQPKDTSYRITLVHAGMGKTGVCGQPFKAHITLWSISGTKLYSTRDKDEPVTFTPGKSEVFLGLEQGVIGMQRDEERMLIVPPEFQRTMNGNAPAVVFPLPKEQTVLVDVEALP